MYRSILITICFLFNQYISEAQNQINIQTKKIDELFEKYNVNTSPGYALGIVNNGKLVYSKGYGMSNLDHDIPITENSAFYIGSMSKQFTTAALLILEAQGKIDLNKPVHQYLPEFPKYHTEITINNLIHHTSGIRETNSLQLFQGIDDKFEEVFNTNDLFNLVIAQKDLNFAPGDEFRYSSGGYAVLAKIVEKISGLSFRKFLEKYIFKPLGMKNTIVYDNHNEIVKNRVVSYWPIEKGNYERRSQVFDAYGDGGIITTIKDLVNWDNAFYDDLLGVENFANKMYQKGKLNNGEEIEYARALQVREYKGHQMITHNGGMLGFRVDMVRFPTLNTSFILLGNSAYLNPTGDILKIADIYLETYLKTEKKTPNDLPEEKEFKIKNDILKKYSGYYWTDDVNYYRRFSVLNDSLFIDSGNIENRQYLKPISINEFSIQGFYLQNKLIFRPDQMGKELLATFGSSKRSFRKFDPKALENINELISYIGTYYSQELTSTYNIFVSSEKLFLKINNNTPIQIFPVPKNSRLIWNSKKMLWIGFGEIKFICDQNNVATGLIIGDGRVSGVKFEKQ